MATATMKPPRPATETPIKGVSHVDHFHERFCLISVRQSRWPGQYVIPAENVQVTVGGSKIDDDKLTPARTDLLPKAWTDAINPIYNRINNIMSQHTVSFGKLSLRILPLRDQPDPNQPHKLISTAELFFNKMGALQQTLTDVINDLLPGYNDEIVRPAREYWLPKLGEDLYNRLIGSKLPSADDLPLRFRISVGAFDMGVADISHISEGELKLHMAAAKKHAEEEIQHALLSAVREPRKQLEKALAALADQLKNGKKLTAASFNGTLQALALVRSFGDAADDELQKVTVNLERRIQDATAAAEGRKISFAESIASLQPGLVAAVQAASKVVQDESSVAASYRRFGVMPRGVSWKSGEDDE